MLTILNTSIITAYGKFEYKPTSLEEVKDLISAELSEGVLSAVGHQSTAETLTELLGIEIPVNRIQYSQEVGEVAVVFKLRGRAPEGKILERSEIENIGYDFGILTRTA